MMMNNISGSSTGHIIIEIKAKCTDQNKVRELLKAHKADFKGIDNQTDTYFNVNYGRLKLREGNIENNLIFYKRENKEDPKQSDVVLYNSKPESSLKQILTSSLGILTIVNKKREIYFIENIKFHIDQVIDLGTFVEIEAINSSGTISKEKLHEQCRYYLELFGIKKEELVSKSYSDMLISKK